jgi:RimJ/RimL family protein N-acetyltransferase
VILFRHATINDTDELLAWRNDEVTRACFRSTEIVNKADHENWMKFNVAQGYPAHIVLIAESDIGTVGVVRFDADKSDVMTYEMSITVAPKQRGKGLAKPMLGTACAFMSECVLTAEVRISNYVSRHIFDGCGFHEMGRDQDFIRYRKEPTA